MKLPTWLGGKAHGSQESESSPLVREFVYIDEVSVYSLASSAGVPPAVSETESSSSQDSFEFGTAGGFNAGVAKADVNTKLNLGDSRGRQIERKYNIQATFAGLRRDLASEMLLSATRLESPRASAPESLRAAVTDLRSHGQAFSEGDLRRGAVVELQVELGADSAFAFSSVLGSFLQMAKASPDLIPMDGELASVVQAGRLLDQLLVNLVPVRGIATDFQVVRSDGEQWIVSTRAVNELKLAHLASPLVVVGVTERDLYWRDTRRVLFSELTFTVMGRLAKTGLQNSWSGVKLLEVLRQFMPGELELDFDALLRADAGKGLASDVSNALAREAGSRDAEERLYRALADDHGVLIDEDEVASLRALPIPTTPSPTLKEDLQRLLTAADAFYARRADLTRDNDRVAELRAECLSPLPDDSQVTAESQTSRPEDGDPTSAGQFLELEFVAIYW